MHKNVTAMSAAAALALGLALAATHAAPARNVATAPTGPIPPNTPLPSGSNVATNASAPSGTAPQPAAALTAEDLDAWLDGYLPYALHTADIAGAVVAVVKDGQILSERGYGYSDVEARAPVDPKLTLFRPGSVSKLVTWTAVMQLVEQGKIDLDADVNGYLDFKIPARDGKPVTMRNLMQHVAGFEEQAKGIISEDPKAPGFETLLKQWVPQRVFEAGSTPAYSNYGASLAGYIVQRISGEAFDTYVEKHIFAPLDMPHSSFRQPLPAELVPLMSKGYQLASEAAHPFEIIGPAPAGAMSSPAEDMAHFMIAHLQDGEYHGNRILSAATAEMMHNSPLTVLPPLNRMELGFFETNVNGREVIGHLGDTSYFHTSLHLFLKEGVGLYVSFNSTGRSGAAGSLRTALFDDFADRYFPVPASSAQIDAKTAAAHAAMLVGHWVNSRGSQSNFLAVVGFIGQTKVSLGPDGQLVVPFNGLNEKPRHWIEIAPFLWRDRDGHERLSAKVANGKVVRFSIDELSPFMVFDRAPWYQDGAWLLPLFYASLGVLLLTALLWPMRALVRRHYKARLALDPAGLRAYKLSRIAAVLILAGLGLWAFTVARMLNDLNSLSAASDPLVHLAEVVGAIVFIGGFAAVLWNLVAVWTGRRRWPARIWSVALALAALTVLWIAFAFHLIGFGVNY